MMIVFITLLLATAAAGASSQGENRRVQENPPFHHQHARSLQEEQQQQFDPGQESLCPCLNSSSVSSELQLEAMRTYFSTSPRNEYLDTMAFQLGCGYHHKYENICNNNSGFDDQNEHDDLAVETCRMGGETLYPLSPLPIPTIGSSNSNSCGHSQLYPECYRQFCIVDIDNCALAYHDLEVRGPNLSSNANVSLGVSYATCGYLNIQSGLQRQRDVIEGIQNRTLRVGLLSEPNGWTSLKSTNNEHYLGPWQRWKGPTLNFVQNAALQGKFSLRLVNPYDYEVLVNRSRHYYNGSTSPYDLCVYATAAGYIDLCIGDFSITDRRIFETGWIKLQSRPLRLAVPFSFEKDSIAEDVLTFFYPYTWDTWIFMLFFLVPAMASLFFFFDDGLNDVFMKTEAAAIAMKKENKDDPKREYVVLDNIPWYSRLFRGLSVSYLAMATRSFPIDAVSLPAKINFYGMSFFLFGFGITYTANLAAQLTRKNLVVPVNSFQDALDKSYRLCISRKKYEVITAFWPGLSPEYFVVDPVDGLPGFDVSASGQEILVRRIDPNRAIYDPSYCDAAILSAEYLEMFHSQGKYCNMMIIDDDIALESTGMPISTSPLLEHMEEYFEALESRGDFVKEVFGAQPASHCSYDNESKKELGLVRQKRK